MRLRTDETLLLLGQRLQILKVDIYALQMGFVVKDDLRAHENDAQNQIAYNHDAQSHAVVVGPLAGILVAVLERQMQPRSVRLPAPHGLLFHAVGLLWFGCCHIRLQRIKSQAKILFFYEIFISLHIIIKQQTLSYK